MGLRSGAECDACGHTITDGDDCYCKKCYNEFEEECSRLEDRISNLEAEIKRLQEIIANCSHCGGSYTAEKL